MTLPLALLLPALARPLASPALAAPAVRQGAYGVEVRLLYGMFSMSVPGNIQEIVDLSAGRYEVQAVGRGRGLTSRVESNGVMRDGRWAPEANLAAFEVLGRRTETRMRYDYRRGSVEYHYQGETFFLRRRRQADDVVAIPEGVHVDDAVSAILNYALDQWWRIGDGRVRTHVVRRRRRPDEGVDDVEASYAAEIVPVEMVVTTDPATHRSVGTLDLTGFSSWAKPDEPARVTLDRDRRPITIEATLILGTSVSIRFQPTA